MQYTSSLNDLDQNQLTGFFVGWPSHPDTITHLKILKNSFAVWLAIDDSRCIGFINALSDGVFYAYIPLLEVIPDYQGHGIGTELLNRMIHTLKDMYAIDLVCDESVTPFYSKLEFSRCVGMIKRNYHQQTGIRK
ncbi:MAG: GNAT family N-acetyltransferase [Candidatus Marinimicrobia bacterium]|nr:GNAT family N-acetyltransferase [Candidatus Neomarinimicrobiota bacterium]